MDQDRIMGLVRQILPVFGGLAVALGWLTQDQVGYWTGLILQIAGPVSVLVGIVWTWIANGKPSIAASIGAMPETTVTPKADGTATVTINDPALAKAAVDAQKAAA